MHNEKTESTKWVDQNNQNSLNLLYWAGAWCLSMAFAAFGPRLLWDFNTPLTILAVLLNLATGFGMIISNKKYLRGLDELQRKIQMDAMAFSLGVGLVVGLAYEILEDVKLITFEPEISHLIIVMSLAMFGGIIAGRRHFE